MDKEFMTLYSVKEVAEMLGVTTRSVRNYLKSGALKGKRAGGQWRFSPEDVDAMMASAGREKAETDMSVGKFLENTDVLPEGSIRMCTVCDYYCSNRIDAEKKAGHLRAIITGMGVQGASFEYEFFRAKRKARFVFTGDGKFISQVVELINNE